MLQTIVMELSLLRSQGKQREHLTSALQETVNALQNTNEALVTELQNLKRANAPSGGGRKKRHVEGDGESLPAPAVAAAAAAAAVPSLPPMRLSHANEAHSVAKGPKGAGVTVSTLLSDFSIDNHLAQGDWKDVVVASAEHQEPQCLKNALEFCRFVCTPKEVPSIRNGKSLDKETSLQLAGTIQDRAFVKAWTLEGKNPDDEKKKIEAKGSQNSLKPTHLAVGKHVRVCKQALAVHKGFDKKGCNEEPVCERPEDLTWSL